MLMDFDAFCEAVEHAPSVFALHAYAVEREAALAARRKDSATDTSTSNTTGSKAASTSSTDGRKAQGGGAATTSDGSAATVAATAAPPTISDEQIVAFGSCRLVIDDELLRREAAGLSGYSGSSSGQTRGEFGVTPRHRAQPVTAISAGAASVSQQGSEGGRLSTATRSQPQQQQTQGGTGASLSQLGWSIDSGDGDDPLNAASPSMPIAPLSFLPLGGAASGTGSVSGVNGSSKFNTGSVSLAAGRRSASARIDRLVVDELEDDDGVSSGSSGGLEASGGAGGNASSNNKAGASKRAQQEKHNSSLNAPPRIGGSSRLNDDDDDEGVAVIVRNGSANQSPAAAAASGSNDTDSSAAGGGSGGNFVIEYGSRRHRGTDSINAQTSSNASSAHRRGRRRSGGLSSSGPGSPGAASQLTASPPEASPLTSPVGGAAADAASGGPLDDHLRAPSVSNAMGLSGHADRSGRALLTSSFLFSVSESFASTSVMQTMPGPALESGPAGSAAMASLGVSGRSGAAASLRVSPSMAAAAAAKNATCLTRASLTHLGFSRAGAIASLLPLINPDRLIVCSHGDPDVAVVDVRVALATARRVERGPMAMLSRAGEIQRPLAQMFYTDSEPRHASASSNGKVLAVGLANGAVNRYDLNAGRPLPALLHGSAVTCIAYGGSGKVLAAGTEDGPCVLWTMRQQNQPPVATTVFNDHAGAATAIAFDPVSAEQVLSGSVDGTARLWRSAPGGAKGDTVTSHTSAVIAVAFDSAGRLALSCSHTQLQVVSVDSGAVLALLTSRDERFGKSTSMGSSLAFKTFTAMAIVTSPRRFVRYLLVGTSDRQLHILEMHLACTPVAVEGGAAGSSKRRGNTTPDAGSPAREDASERIPAVVQCTIVDEPVFTERAHRALTTFGLPANADAVFTPCDDDDDDEPSTFAASCTRGGTTAGRRSTGAAARRPRHSATVYCGDVDGNVYNLQLTES